MEREEVLEAINKNYSIIYEGTDEEVNVSDIVEYTKKEMIEKACEWLNDSLYPTVKTNFDNIVDVQSTQEFVMLFRKTMEE